MKRIKTILFSIAISSVAAVGLSATPGPNTSISHSIFGGTYSKTGCLTRAEATIRNYLRIHGGYGLSTAKGDDWIVVGWNVEPGSIDVVFTCADAVAKESIGNAYVSFHATGANAKANIKTTRERLVTIWSMSK